MKVAWLAAAAVAFATPAFADQVKVGRLQCDVSGGMGMIVASSKAMECRFLPLRGRAQSYHGVIRKFGLDVGATGRGVMSWDVYAPATPRMRHALAGDYSGLGATAAVGVGLGANGLMGGPNHDISLQPTSVAMQTGLNVAAGVASMELLPGA